MRFRLVLDGLRVDNAGERVVYDYVSREMRINSGKDTMADVRVLTIRDGKSDGSQLEIKEIEDFEVVR